MEQEIKITISKKHLTYYSMCFIIIIGTFASGYYWGAYSVPERTTAAASRQSLEIEYAPISPLQFSETPSVTPGREVPTLSDSSWSEKAPSSAVTRLAVESTIPRVETHRYYTSELVNTASDSPQSASRSPETGETAGDSRAFVASKNGTKYYPTSCKSADRINPENRVYFASVEAAELEGLTRTSTCK